MGLRALSGAAGQSSGFGEIGLLEDALPVVRFMYSRILPFGASWANRLPLSRRLSCVVAPLTLHAGNRIEYTLGNAGNRTAENTKDAGGSLHRALSRSSGALGRAQQTTGRE